MQPSVLLDLGVLLLGAIGVAAFLLISVRVLTALANENLDVTLAVRLGTLLFALALVGIVSGYSGGLSREAAVGDIIPAALTLLGGVAIYLFGVDQSRGTIVSIGAIAFAAALFFGFSLGSEKRNSRDAFELLQTHCLSIFREADLLADGAALALDPDSMGRVCSGVVARIAVDAEFVSTKDQRNLANKLEAAIDTWLGTDTPPNGQ